MYKYKSMGQLLIIATIIKLEKKSEQPLYRGLTFLMQTKYVPLDLIEHFERIVVLA